MSSADNQKGFKRILGSMLHEYIGKSVILFGTLIQLEPSGKMLQMKTTDDQIVNVQLQQPPIDPIEGILEVRGTVTSNDTVLCSKYIPFVEEVAENFDPRLYTDIVEAMCMEPVSYANLI